MTESPNTNRCQVCNKQQIDPLSFVMMDEGERADFCHCALPNSSSDAADQVSVQICRTCEKRVQDGRAGSITQWIFRHDLCSCETPDVISVDAKTLVTASTNSALKAYAEERKNEQEIVVEDKGFPLDTFKPLEKLASGGVGNIYKCRSRYLGNLVVVKTLRALTPDNFLQIQQEAKVISRLNHDNILKIFDLGLVEDQYPFMVVEYVKGDTLSNLLRDSGPLAVKPAVRVFIQICDGLIHAHERGIFHRDLSSVNILIQSADSSAPTVKIIDFGLSMSKANDRQVKTQQGLTIVGTTAYMSPDQIAGQPYDARSEVYSLGCLMFESLTGHAPFRGETSMQVLAQHSEAPAPKLNEVSNDLEFPNELVDIVDKCLSKNKADRYQSMAELQTDLMALDAQIDKQPGVRVHIPGTKNVSSTRKLKNWPLVSALVALFLVLAGSFLYVIFQYDNTLDVEKAKSDKLFFLRSNNQITMRHVRTWLWHDIEGQVSNEQLSVLPQLDVKRLDLSSSSITDEQLTYLTDLPLIALDLRDTKITDKGIETILKLRGLQALLLERCPGLTQKGYRLLGKLKTLKILSLRDSNVSDEDLKYISKLSALRLLYISNSPNVSDAAIDQILKLSKLQSLRIGGTNVTTQGIEKLKDHESLVFIGINDLKLSDDKMPQSFSHQLTMLDLSRNPLTYNGLTGVLALPTLWYLDVRECPNISYGDSKRLSNRFQMDQGRFLMKSGLVTSEFSESKDEFYFNPEYYKESPSPEEFNNDLLLDAR